MQVKSETGVWHDVTCYYTAGIVDGEYAEEVPPNATRCSHCLADQ